MRELGLEGVRRGKVKHTTIADETAPRPMDLADRQLHAERPDQLWVVDLTDIRTWVRFAYLVLVTDVFSRRIVGWALTTHMRTDLLLEALEMAIWTRRRQGVDDRPGSGGAVPEHIPKSTTGKQCIQREDPLPRPQLTLPTMPVVASHGRIAPSQRTRRAAGQNIEPTLPTRRSGHAESAMLSPIRVSWAPPVITSHW